MTCLCVLAELLQKLPQVRVEPTTLTITGLKVRCFAGFAKLTQSQAFIKLYLIDFRKDPKSGIVHETNFSYWSPSG